MNDAGVFGWLVWKSYLKPAVSSDWSFLFLLKKKQNNLVGIWGWLLGHGFLAVEWCCPVPKVSPRGTIPWTMASHRAANRSEGFPCPTTPRVPAQASRQMLVNTRSWLHCTPEAQGKATKQTMYNYVLQKSLEKISRQRHKVVKLSLSYSSKILTYAQWFPGYCTEDLLSTSIRQPTNYSWSRLNSCHARVQKNTNCSDCSTFLARKIRHLAGHAIIACFLKIVHPKPLFAWRAAIRSASNCSVFKASNSDTATGHCPPATIVIRLGVKAGHLEWSKLPDHEISSN